MKVNFAKEFEGKQGRQVGNQVDISEEAKEKYQGMFEFQKSGDKTSFGEIGLDIRIHASPKVGQDQVSGGVSVLCWHAAPVAYALWKPSEENISSKISEDHGLRWIIFRSIQS